MPKQKRKPRYRKDLHAACEALVTAQLEPPRIARELAEKFNTSERTIYRYIDRVYEFMAESAKDDRSLPRRRHALRLSLQSVFQKAMKTNQLHAAVAALDRLGKLDGLWGPTQIELDVNHNTVDLMTSDQQRKRLFQLAAKVGIKPITKANKDGGAANGANGADHGSNGSGQPLN